LTGLILVEISLIALAILIQRAVWFRNNSFERQLFIKKIFFAAIYFVMALIAKYYNTIFISLFLLVLILFTFLLRYVKNDSSIFLNYWKSYAYLLFASAITSILLYGQGQMIFYSFLILSYAMYLDLFISFLFLNKYPLNIKNEDFKESIQFSLVVFLFTLLIIPRTQVFLILSVKALSLNSYLFVFDFILLIIIIFIYLLSDTDSIHFSLPFIFAVLLTLFLKQPSSLLILKFLAGIILGIVVVYPSYRLKMLNITGAQAAFLLAVIIFGLGGIKWSVPILFFFVPSSLLSKLRKRFNKNVDVIFEKGEIRDRWQVLANGGLSIVFIFFNLFFPTKLFYLLYLTSLAAVSADTWATEIGVSFKGKTYDVINFKKVPVGSSGGVSLVGTVGGLAGAIIIAISGLVWINPPDLLTVTAAGFIGCFTDSLLGSAFQVKYICKICGETTEKAFHCGEETKYLRGLRFLNNDWVNFLASLLSAIIVIAFFSLYF